MIHMSFAPHACICTCMHPQNEAGRSLDVKMSKNGDSNLYRFVFGTAKEAALVAGLAEKALHSHPFPRTERVFFSI